jgi:hypothetical protein
VTPPAGRHVLDRPRQRGGVQPPAAPLAGAIDEGMSARQRARPSVLDFRDGNLFRGLLFAVALAVPFWLGVVLLVATLKA